MSKNIEDKVLFVIICFITVCTVILTLLIWTSFPDIPLGDRIIGTITCVILLVFCIYIFISENPFKSE